MKRKKEGNDGNGDDEGEGEDDDDDEGGQTLQPLQFDKILNSLVYEFRGRGGNMNVIAIYSSYYIIDRLNFTVAEVLETQRLGNMIFNTPGSITTFNMEEFLRLIEDIVMQSLLL